MSTAPTIICLTGPTAAGKSAATHAIAQRWDIEIIVMDSATIYQGMDIGTAKPTAAEQAAVPHHLLDICDPSQHYSAAQFVHDTTHLIADIHARGRQVLLCGGTLLYYKALREGLSPLPEAQPELRAQLDAEALNKGWPQLHQELAAIDPTTAARLAPTDSQRIQRALEVYRSSGHPLSYWLEQPRTAPTPYHYLSLSLEPEQRLQLMPRISQRYHQMMEQGLLAEVQALYNRGDLHLDLPAIRSVGYRQLWHYLDGEVSLEQAIENAILATGQLAKRQMTWLRAMKQRIAVDCLDPKRAQVVVDQVAHYWPSQS